MGSAVPRRGVPDRPLLLGDSGLRRTFPERRMWQVGKTYTLKAFGEQYFENLGVVDLEGKPGWHRLF